MSFCWQDEPSSFKLDSTNDQFTNCLRSESNSELLLKTHLKNQFGIITPELTPLVAICLELPTPAKSISFSQILNYKKLLESAVDRQNKFLEDTGVKLEAYYSTFPSGFLLEDREFEDHVCKALFNEDLPENSALDHVSPTTSVISGFASPIWSESPFLESSKQKPLKRMGSGLDFRDSNPSQVHESKQKRGYQKNYSGRTIFPIREPSLEQLASSPLFDINLAEASDPLNNRAAHSSYSASEDLDHPGPSASPGLLSPREDSSDIKTKTEKKNLNLKSLFDRPTKKKSESLALELRKADDSGTTPELQNLDYQLSQQHEFIASEEELEEEPDEAKSHSFSEKEKQHLDTPHDVGADGLPRRFGFEFDSHQLVQVEDGFTPKKEMMEKRPTPQVLTLNLGKSVDRVSQRCSSPINLPRSTTLDLGNYGNRLCESGSSCKSELRREQLRYLLAPKVDWREIEPQTLGSRTRHTVTLKSIPSFGTSLRDIKEEFKLPVCSERRVGVRMASSNPPGPISLRTLGL